LNNNFPWNIYCYFCLANCWSTVASWIFDCGCILHRWKPLV